MNKRTLAVSEAVGCVVIYAAAVFLHFFYRLSGGSPLSILYGAVNESVWEHTKIFSAGYLGYALLQLCWIKVPFKRYVVAKCAGLYFLMLAMIGFFYLYTAVTGRSIPIVDVTSSAVFAVLAQAISCRLITGDLKIEDYFAPALMLLLLYYLMFFSFTVFPPRLGLFRDPISSGYGLIVP
nr:DUF6512 family protein [uncultured Ruminococcus sp.]